MNTLELMKYMCYLGELKGWSESNTTYVFMGNMEGQEMTSACLEHESGSLYRDKGKILDNRETQKYCREKSEQSSKL